MTGKTYKTTTSVVHGKPNSVNVDQNPRRPRRQVALRALYQEGRTLGIDCLMCGQSLSDDEEVQVQERMLELEDEIREHRERHPGEVIELSLSVDDILGSAQGTSDVVTCPFCDQNLSEQEARTCARRLHDAEGRINRTILENPTGPTCITIVLK